MKKTIVIMALLALAGCRKGELDGHIVRGAKGDFYRLRWAMVDSYVLYPIDTAEINAISK